MNIKTKYPASSGALLCANITGKNRLTNSIQLLYNSGMVIPHRRLYGEVMGGSTVS
jgi:hypothetical protein